MRALKSMKRKIAKAIKKLTKKFGVTASVYAPTNEKSLAYGYQDDNAIVYNEEAIYEGKLLIPSIFSPREDTFGGVFDYGEDENVLYTDKDTVFPVFSKIIVEIKGKTLAYVIKSIETVEDDEGAFYHKYILAQVTNLDVTLQKDQIIDAAEEVIENLDDNLFLDEEVTKNETTELDSGLVLDPIQ